MEDQAIIDALKAGALPTSDQVVQSLNMRVGRSREALLRHHAHWKENQLRTGLDALISAAMGSHLDLCRCEATLSAYANSREPFEDHVDYTVSNPAQKELMAFCAAYFGTIDTLRRIKSARSDIAEKIEQLRLDTASGPPYKFVLDLRKNISHGSVVLPGWSIASNFHSASGSMRFYVESLLSFGEWSVEARQFLLQMRKEHFAISAVTAECAKGLAEFRRELRTLFFRNPTAAEADFNEIEDTHKRVVSRQWMKIFLGPHAQKGTNPYDYLHRFLSAEEVREILRRPNHSVEQVELIIALKSSQTHCDDELRKILYQLFQVPLQRTT